MKKITITKEEKIKIIDRITDYVTAGGGSDPYQAVSPKKLAVFLYEIMTESVDGSIPTLTWSGDESMPTLTGTHLPPSNLE